MNPRQEEPCIDTETGEILYPPLYNAETGEYENIPNHPLRIRFRIPSTREQKPTNNSKWPCCKVDKPEVEFITALVFLLPTMILFHPILSIVTCVLEIILHSWVHKKNKTLRDGTFYYKSPLHGIVKEFCGRCKDQQTKDKITKIQDIRNNKMQRYELEYIKSMVT